MTPNRAKIVVPNPCSEKWDVMHMDSIGRFCQSCQKSVIDFTTQSDGEIKNFLKNKRGEKLCGRFNNHQLQRIRIEIDQNILVSNIPFWQKFLVVLLVCFGSDLLGADFVFAQTDSIPVKTEQVDSLIPFAAAKSDSTLEVKIDSAFVFDLHLKMNNYEVICDPEIIAMLGQTMGMFYIPDPSIDLWDPEGTIHFIDPETGEDAPADILVKERKPEILPSEILFAPEHYPLLPNHPKKKPVRPIESAIIADNGERRKTRRS